MPRTGAFWYTNQNPLFPDNLIDWWTGFAILLPVGQCDYLFSQWLVDRWDHRRNFQRGRRSGRSGIITEVLFCTLISPKFGRWRPAWTFEEVHAKRNLYAKGVWTTHRWDFLWYKMKQTSMHRDRPCGVTVCVYVLMHVDFTISEAEALSIISSFIMITCRKHLKYWSKEYSMRAIPKTSQFYF